MLEQCKVEGRQDEARQLLHQTFGPSTRHYALAVGACGTDVQAARTLVQVPHTLATHSCRPLTAQRQHTLNAPSHPNTCWRRGIGHTPGVHGVISCHVCGGVVMLRHVCGVVITMCHVWCGNHHVSCVVWVVLSCRRCVSPAWAVTWWCPWSCSTYTPGPDYGDKHSPSSPKNTPHSTSAYATPPPLLHRATHIDLCFRLTRPSICVCVSSCITGRCARACVRVPSPPCWSYGTPSSPPPPPPLHLHRRA